MTSVPRTTRSSRPVQRTRAPMTPVTTAQHTERIATEALDAYDTGTGRRARVRRREAGTRCDLARWARVHRRDRRCAALAPVLDLPPAQRIHGIVTSAEHVQRALLQAEKPGPAMADLRGALENFTATRLSLPG